MTFFYDLNKKLDTIREKPELKHGQLNERDMGKHNNKTTGFKAVADKAAKEYGSKAAGERVAGAVKAKMAKAGKLEEETVEEGMEQLVQRIGGIARKAKKIGGKALDKLGHGSDEDMIRDLQKKAGVPQTGKKPQQPVSEDGMGEGVDKKAFAKLAPPKDKITFADKIAGAKKEVDEMLGDVAAEAIKGALSPKQKKLDKNQNGSLDANDFAMLRKGAKKKPKPFSSDDYDEYGVRQSSSFNKPPKEETDEGWDDMLKDVEKRRGQMKTGEKVKGHKGEIEKTATGIRHTRSYDEKTGETDSDDQPAGEKRGRGRPKGTGGPRQERATAKSRKSDRTAHGQSGFKKAKAVDEGADEGNDLVKLAKVIQSCQSMDQLETARKMAQNFLRKHSSHDSVGFSGIAKDFRRRDDAVSDIERKKKELQGGQELDEKAVSKKQQKFMGMVHAAQKGEKPASKEVAKVAKTMKKKDAEDFASTKHKGLPEKKKPEAKKEAPKKKKEKTEEAGGTGTPTASSGFSFGKGIYDSINHELEKMIAESMARLDESMNISLNVNSDAMNGGPNKTLTVNATDDDALKLGKLLKNAGLGDGSEPGDAVADEIRTAIDSHDEDEACPACGSTECGCETEEMDEAYGDNVASQNEPNWPTNQETAQDNLEYSGGLNKPKASGMATIPVTDVAVDGEDKFSTPARLRESEYKAELRKMMEAAGIQVTDEMLDEGWREKLAAAGTAAAIGATGLGMMGGMPGQNVGDYQPVKPTEFTQQVKANAPVTAKAEAMAKINKQFANEYYTGVQKIQDDPVYKDYPKIADQRAAEFTQQLLAKYQANEGLEEDAIKRMMEMAGIKEAKKVEEDDVEEGNKFTGNLAKARADGKKEADLDGDGDMEKVKESIFSLTNQWKAYKG